MARRIPEEKLTVWNLLRKKDDARVIAAEAGVAPITVYKALQAGQGSVALEEKITAFYDRRKSQLKEMI